MKFKIYGLPSLLATVIILSCSSEEAAIKDTTISKQDAYVEMLSAGGEFSNDLSLLSEMKMSEEQMLLEISDEQNAQTTHFQAEPFVFFVIGDSELNMRGNTYPQLLNWIERINAVESFDVFFTSGNFDEGESMKITKPEMVFLAGDICKDRALGFSLPGDINFQTKTEINRLFNQLDDDILFLPGNGNHDWDPYRWGDGDYGHNFGGLLSNLGTAQFVRSRYRRALQSTELESGATFNYDRNTTWFPLTSSAEFNYSLIYKGLRFTQLNQFLQQPVAMVSFESITGSGPAWYFKNRTGSWFRKLSEESGAGEIPHVVIQHFPVRTGDSWWDDDLGGTPDGLRKEYLDMLSMSYLPVMFSGHNHFQQNTNVLPYEITDHTAGYFADGYVIAVKASADKGVYAVAHLNLETMETSDPSSYSNTFSVPQ